MVISGAEILCGARKGFWIYFPTRLIYRRHYFACLGLVNHMPGTGKAVESALRDLAVKASRLLDVD
jgi:hypothetical protein